MAEKGETVDSTFFMYGHHNDRQDLRSGLERITFENGVELFFPRDHNSGESSNPYQYESLTSDQKDYLLGIFMDENPAQTVGVEVLELKNGEAIIGFILIKPTRASELKSRNIPWFNPSIVDHSKLHIIPNEQTDAYINGKLNTSKTNSLHIELKNPDFGSVTVFQIGAVISALRGQGCSGFELKCNFDDRKINLASITAHNYPPEILSPKT
jgi:hypothetical protein